MSTSKKATEKKGLYPATKKRESDLRSNPAVDLAMNGVGCRSMTEPLPEYVEAECEKVINPKPETGACIVLGRDRTGSRRSGHGGKGETACAMIDLVCGRGGYKAKAYGTLGDQAAASEGIQANPMFDLDAARIYISQKTNIDAAFGLVAGKVGQSHHKSGIGIKADAVRVMAREGIKLITKCDKKNSQGGAISSALGIDLIAGNDDGHDEHGMKRLQPIPKGDNLAKALEMLAKNVTQLNAIVFQFIKSQMEFNIQVAQHVHISPFLGIPVPPSPMLIPAGMINVKELATRTIGDNVKNKINIQGFVNNFLKKQGPFYINSRYNSTT